MQRYIEIASAQLNADIQVKIDKEIVKQIDDVKLNTINGSNATFYTRHFPIGDANDDAEVTVADIAVYSVDGTAVRTSLTVSSITPSTGQFVLSAAPSTDTSRLELEYHYAPVSVDTPHPLVKMACAMLAAAFAYAKLNIGCADRVKFGTIQFYRHVDSFDIYYKRYQDTIARINNRMADKADAESISSV